MPINVQGEILVDLMKRIIKELPQLKAIHCDDHTILVHGMGGQTRGFYHNLKQNRSVELLWTGWSSAVWWTYLLSFIPGQARLSNGMEIMKQERVHADYYAFDPPRNQASIQFTTVSINKFWAKYDALVKLLNEEDLSN